MLLDKDLYDHFKFILRYQLIFLFFWNKIIAEAFRDVQHSIKVTKYSLPYQILSILQDIFFFLQKQISPQFFRLKMTNHPPIDTQDPKFILQIAFVFYFQDLLSLTLPRFNNLCTVNINVYIISMLFFHHRIENIQQKTQRKEMQQTSDLQANNSSLLALIPKVILAKCSSSTYYDSQPETLPMIYQSIKMMASHPKQEQLADFFKQINLNHTQWLSLQNHAQKTQFILKCLQKNVSDHLTTVNNSLNTYLTNINSNNGNTAISRGGFNNSSQINEQQFDWLHLNTKNQMLKPKLKTKLVQSINQYKNQKKLRAVHDQCLEDNQKVCLSDDSFDLEQDDPINMKYSWSKEDEVIFIQNVNNLKQKFTNTQFLKNCQRYKFVTNHELCTLASQQISRKLDKSTKAFLSRQFLLDKYFSTKQNLTQKQMKFILKTSPLLGKCVDKNFVKAAVRNIRYEDIDKMQLQIAEQIIKKFESIRNLVKKSRKQFKQNNNQKAKQKIKKFEQKSSYEMQRAMVIEQLQRHKVKMMRKLNYISKCNTKNECYTPKKMAWPVPLNVKHPSTGLFVRDCVNQQSNQDFNLYEKNYMQRLRNKEGFQKASRCEMIEFYSGGPLQNNPQNIIHISRDMVKLVCNAFKTSYYNKQLSEKLDNLDWEDVQDRKNSCCKTTKTICENIAEMTKRTKKSGPDENQDTQKMIKQKILEKSQKSKNTLMVKKLLTLAAENSFMTLKALNPKLTPSQINACDRKGNCSLFYTIKHRNIQFMEFLLSKKADVNVKCSKGLTPLHLAFKTKQYSLICKCLIGFVAPNLNALDDDNKTPLYYSSRKILEMLGLQSGVVSVDTKNHKFDNNYLLQQIRQKCSYSDELQGNIDFRKYNANQAHGEKL